MGHIQVFLDTYGKNTTAFLSHSFPNNLVIFVHGFIGNATKTWEEFPQLFKTHDDFDTSDIIFYDYESLKGQVSNNAIKFYEFLKAVCENSPNEITFKRNIIEKDFAYSKVLLVAHSLGSIIVRRALLNAKSENKIWLSKCKMILFAPAHCGARVQNKFASLPVVGNCLLVLGLIYPVLDDLKPESQTISNLKSDSKRYLKINQGSFTIAHSVVWAENELIVYNEIFCSDPVAKLMANKTHITVCKPNHTTYIEPYKIVVDAL